jgi:hypothetical protein
MTATDYLEAKVLDHCLKNTAFAQPAALYMALFTANPGETGTANEVIGGSYARQPVAFGAAAAGQSVSSGAVNFTAMPAVTVTHFGVFDAVSAGNPLFNGALTASQTVSAGATLAFNPGQVVITCD